MYLSQLQGIVESRFRIVEATITELRSEQLRRQSHPASVVHEARGQAPGEHQWGCHASPRCVSFVQRVLGIIRPCFYISGA